MPSERLAGCSLTLMQLLQEYLKSNLLAPRFSSKHITMSSFPPPPPILSMLPMGDATSERPSPAGSRKSTPGLTLSPLADLSPGTGTQEPLERFLFLQAANNTQAFSVLNPASVLKNFEVEI